MPDRLIALPDVLVSEALPGMAALRMPAHAVLSQPFATAPLALNVTDLVSPAVLNLALQLGASAGVPRAQATAPVSPADPPTDAMLFEDPADPSRRLYLPRYEIVLRAPDEYAVAIEDRAAAGWALTVALRPVPAPGVTVDAATELPHGASLVLTYQQHGGGVRELAFEPPVREGGELRAELRMPDLPSRDAVIRALSDPAAGTRLVVRRTCELCVPVPGTGGGAGETPPILVHRVEPNAFALREHALLAEPARGRARLAMRRRDDVDGGPHGLPEIEPDPVPAPQPVGEVRAEPLFRRCVTVLDAQVGETLTFDRDAHAYVFQAVLRAAPGHGGLRRHRVRYGDRWHRYFQDPDHRNLFYHLPDEYRIPRAERGSHAPMLRVRVSPGSADPHDLSIVTDYVAVGVVDPDRLADAAKQLAAKVPAGFGPPEFERFEVRPENLRYRVRLPRANGAPADEDAGTSATLELRSIKHSFALPVDRFQGIFDAICGAVTTLFAGTVELTLDGDQQPELIEVLTRAEDFAGQLFDVAPDAAGADAVTVRNLVESPIRLTGMPAAQPVGGAEPAEPSAAVGTDGALVLAAGASATFHVGGPQAADPVTGARLIDVRAEIVPDRKALWAAILDPASPNSRLRPLTIKAESMFAPPDPVNPIVGILVDFDTGDTVELTPVTATVATHLATPISDLIVPDADAEKADGFRYRCRVIRRPPREEPEPVWVQDSFPTLYL